MKQLVNTSKHGLLLLIALFVSAGDLYAQETATIRARFNNTDRDRMYFTFGEQADANIEFPYRAGRELEFNVDLDGITMMRINTFVLVLVQPGDEIDIEVDYEGKSYRKARFTGASQESVIASTVLDQIRRERLQREYKTNIPAALAVQTSPAEFFRASVSEWEAELKTLETVRDQLSPAVYNFVRSELDAIFIPNIITFPRSEQEEGYWSAFDDYQLRDDDASLSNFSYLAALHPYMQYALQKKALESGDTYQPARGLEAQYAEIAEFYDGKLRDAALLVFLYGAFASGQDFERAESLFQDYVKQYNLNPRYKSILDDVMK